MFAFLNPEEEGDTAASNQATAQLEFRVMTYVGLGLGLCTSTFYMVVIREVALTKEAEECDARYKAALGGTTAEGVRESDDAETAEPPKKKDS